MLATWDAWPKISDDVFYVTVDANVNVKRPFVQPYSDAVYIDFDAPRRDTSQSNFSAGVNDLTMLWADIRQACNPSDPLLLVPQNGDKATAVTIENNMAAVRPFCPSG